MTEYLVNHATDIKLCQVYLEIEGRSLNQQPQETITELFSDRFLLFILHFLTFIASLHYAVIPSTTACFAVCELSRHCFFLYLITHCVYGSYTKEVKEGGHHLCSSSLLS